MEEVILAMIVTIIFGIIQQASSSRIPAEIITGIISCETADKDFLSHQAHTSVSNDNDSINITGECEETLLNIFQQNNVGKREMLVHELRKISVRYDTSTFFEKYPDVHKYIFNIP